MIIVLVEDNPMNLELQTLLLEAAGHTVHAAGNAEQGILLTRSLHPDLVLMDVSLPEIDGLEATRRLKQDPEVTGVPVIAVTAHAMAGDRERVYAAGCVGYVTKPIDTRTFVQQVEALAVR